MVLVAKTTINRTRHKSFPSSICKVVYQPYQFSWTLDNPAPKTNLIAIKAAYAALDNTSEALYFHAVSVRPAWASQKQFLVREGNHIFYK